MSNSKDTISHPGIVARIGDDNIQVKIMSVSACSACHAKGACSMAEMQEKTIEVKRNSRENYSVGDQVTIILQKSLGTKAVLLAYIVPLFILVLSLAILTSLSLNEGLAAMISIGLMVPYYLILYLLKDRLKKSFDFKIQSNIHNS
jgi:sigma-E factor negative regulatory protein RseC